MTCLFIKFSFLPLLQPFYYTNYSNSSYKYHNIKFPRLKLLPMATPFFSSMYCLTSSWVLFLNCGRFFIMYNVKFLRLLSLLRFLLPLAVCSTILVSIINPAEWTNNSVISLSIQRHQVINSAESLSFRCHNLSFRCHFPSFWIDNS